MKGRTNVGGGGIALNANVVNKEIKSGNIVAGDFVQYYTENAIIEQSGNNLFLGNIRGYVVTVFTTSINYHTYGGSIRLFKNGRQISSYSGYEINDAYVYGNYIVFNSGNSKIIGVLKIDTNGNLILVDSLTLTSSLKYYIAAGNGKICAFYCGTSSSTSQMSFVVCNISEEGILSSLNEQTVSGYGLGYKSDIIFNEYNNSFYVIGAYNSSSSFTSVYARKVEIANDNTVTLQSSSTQLTIPDAISNGVLYQNGDLLVCGKYGYIYAITISTGSYVTLALPENYIPSNIVNGYFVAARSNNTGNSSISLYYFNEQNKEITFINENSFDLQISSELMTRFIEGTRLYVKNYSGYNLNLLTIVNNQYIEEQSDTNYVLPFSEYGHPIGVAKDSGSTGDTIGVYVPVSS